MTAIFLANIYSKWTERDQPKPYHAIVLGTLIELLTDLYSSSKKSFGSYIYLITP